MTDGERTLTSGQVAQELGVSAASVQRYARVGKIPHDVTLGGHYRFNMEEIRVAVAGELPIEKLRVPDDKIRTVLLKFVAGGEGNLTSGEIEAALREHDELRESCQIILREADRFRDEGNSRITDLERELDQLLRGMRTLYVDAGGALHPRVGRKYLLEGLRVMLGEQNALEHEGCSTCTCWERYRGET